MAPIRDTPDGGLSVLCLFRAVRPGFAGRIQFPTRFIGRERVQTDAVDAVKDALLDIGIVPLQAAQQRLDLLPLGTAAGVDQSIFLNGPGKGRPEGLAVFGQYAAFDLLIMLMYGKVSQENYVELTAASAIPNKEIKSPQILRY